MRFKPLNRGTPLMQARLSSLVLLSIVSCVHADYSEQFNANTNPERLGDLTPAKPKTGSSGGFNYQIIQGYAVLEGDILLGPVNDKGKINSKVTGRGLGLNNAFSRWPDGIVPYMAPASNSSIQRANIALAIDHWTEKTSISFVERTDENEDQYPNYLTFVSSYSCASYVGMKGLKQEIMVSDTCSMGSIVHEIGHALGLFHEHTRPDRDNFVQVDWDQIEDGRKLNFEILTAGVQNFGPYDYGSIMHYGEYFFSSSGKRTVIVPDNIEIGQRVALSNQDAASVDLMYSTDLALTQPITRTVSEGLEIDISVFNQGMNGAQELDMKIELAKDSDWKGVSSDSGWQCLSQEAELHCTRPTLSEQRESRFTLLVDPASGSADDLSILLTSRTQDQDTENNVYNDTYKPLQTTDDNANKSAMQSVSTDPRLKPDQNTPVVAAAQGGSSSGDGGGADNGILAGLALIAWGWRRRQRSRS